MNIDEQNTVDLWLLDALLTGKDSRAGRGDENEIVKMEDFALGEIHYLSDGGYSRVFFSEQFKKLVLTDNSRTEVKEKWSDREVEHVRFRLETRIKQWYKDNS